MALLLACLGLLALGAALGCAAAVCFGMQAEDRSGTYRGLRNGSRLGPLARVGRRIVGLSIGPDSATASQAAEEQDGDPPARPLAMT